MAEFIAPEPFDIVIFGATGDLSKIKLLPALFRRYRDGQIDSSCRIIGVSRTKMDREGFIDFVSTACKAADIETTEKDWQGFVSLLHYFQLDATDSNADWGELRQTLNQDERTLIFYLAVAPHIFVPICNALGQNGLNEKQVRVVLEKPIGTDLATARAINMGVGEIFDESQIFRMDHYLGKETVQNLLVLRFANILFEPLWSRNMIDHVQITVSESLGVEGRADYYDRAGALRDIIQNHLLQLLCLIAMEAPNSIHANDIRAEKIKVLRALNPFTAESAKTNTVRAQYMAGTINGQTVNGYAEALSPEMGDSQTETFVAVKAEINNWRWAGVPFYLRTGKRMAERYSEIILQFKSTPYNLFGEGENTPNRLVLRLQPDEGMRLFMLVKEPGPGGMRLKHLPLNLSYEDSFSTISYHDAYERLLMDVARGNLQLFMGHEEVEAAWAWVDSLIKAWAENEQPVEQYVAGTEGPLQAMMLMDRDGRAWSYPEMRA